MGDKICYFSNKTSSSVYLDDKTGLKRLYVFRTEVLFSVAISNDAVVEDDHQWTGIVVSGNLPYSNSISKHVT